MTELLAAMTVPGRAAITLAFGLILGCAWFIPVRAQDPAPSVVATAPPASAPRAALPSAGWQQLSAKEKKALAPLATRWGELSDITKGKWITIAKQFEQLSAAEQAMMHARMTEWVNLSPVQRNQARLNFNTLQNLPKDEKRAKWDEYQSLSPEQKRQLSAANQGPAKTTAPSSKPANAERFVAPPPAWQSSPSAAAPSRAPIDKKTLLPLPPEAAPKAAPQQPEASSPRDEASAS
jgi:hypothetical protein